MATTAAGLEPGSPFGPSIEALAVYLRGLDQQRPFIEGFNTLILKKRRRSWTSCLDERPRILLGLLLEVDDEAIGIAAGLRSGFEDRVLEQRCRLIRCATLSSAISGGRGDPVPLAARRIPGHSSPA